MLMVLAAWKASLARLCSCAWNRLYRQATCKLMWIMVVRNCRMYYCRMFDREMNGNRLSGSAALLSCCG